jgi:hypothetical protein
MKSQCLKIIAKKVKEKFVAGSRRWPDTRTDCPTDRRSKDEFDWNFPEVAQITDASVTAAIALYNSQQRINAQSLQCCKSCHMYVNHYVSYLFPVSAFHIWVGIYSYYTELEDSLKPQPEFQLENLAFQKDLEQELTSISDAQTQSAKESSHEAVSV